MKFTYNWLKDFVAVKIAARQFADKLTMAGLEVTSLEEKEGDFIFEIEVTSNRPDWLSVIGIAREVVAITNSKFKPQNLNLNILIGKEKSSFAIEIQDKKDCPLYTAKIIRGVKVRPSPDWLKKRLELIGCRSVNNVVDITNYVLFTWGEPLHAFDLDKLNQERIIVRRGRKEEKITTIDGEIRMLDPDILVIADKEKAVAVAGIMGGKESEVTESTKNVLLEAAVFNPVIIRRARQKLGVQSESSYRFERSLAPETAQHASWQAINFIQEFSSGRCVLIRSCGLTKTKKKKIILGVSGVQKILGLNIGAARIKNILTKLEFKLKPKAKDNFTVEVPSHRLDIKSEIDLIEEIARVYGYEKIPKTLPKVSPKIAMTGTEGLVCLTKNILLGLGLNEVITYSLIDRDLLSALGLGKDFSPIEIMNPLSKEQEILRPTVIAVLLGCVANNLNQKQGFINIFETSKVFFGEGASIKEELVLGIALCGTRSLLLQQGMVKEEASLLDLKGILEALFARLGIQDYKFNAKDNPSGALIYVNKEKIGTMTKLPRSILEKFDIKNKDVVVTELSLERLFSYANLSRKFAPLPVYPGISRDISIILREGIVIDDILKAMKEKGSPLLREVKVVDYYKGKQIPSGYRGLTISCLYRSDERTLTEAEVNPINSLVSFVLADKFSAQIRKT